MKNERINILFVGTNSGNADTQNDIALIHNATHGDVVLHSTLDDAMTASENPNALFHVFIIDSQLVQSVEDQKKIHELTTNAKRKLGDSGILPLIVEVKDNERQTSQWATHRFGTQGFLGAFRALIKELVT